MKVNESKRKISNLEKKMRENYTRKDSPGCVVYVVEYIVPVNEVGSGVEHLAYAMDDLCSVGAAEVVEHYHIVEDFPTACGIIDTRKVCYD